MFLFFELLLVDEKDILEEKSLKLGFRVAEESLKFVYDENSVLVVAATIVVGSWVWKKRKEVKSS
jgi:hypothetical protein